MSDALAPTAVSSVAAGRASRPRSDARPTFDVLNGLRGVAAISVVTMHLCYYLGPLHPANVAPAVDFFFILSGFVVAFAYERRLIAGMGVGRFALARWIRLYPLYAIGLVAGALAHWAYRQPADPKAVLGQLAFNVFMLPSPFALEASDHALFPLDFTFWSLFFELGANLVYAAVAPRLSRRLLAIIIGLGFAGLAASGLLAGSLDNGTLRTTFFGGLARVTFGFFTGVALFRLWRVRPVRWSIHPAVLFAVLVLPLMFKPGPPFGWIYELGVVAIYMPLMVWLGAGAKASRAWVRICVILGALSYPLYVIHPPIWFALMRLDNWQGSVFLLGHAPWSGIGLVTALCLASWALDAAVDYPLRRRLSEVLLHRATHAGDPDVHGGGAQAAR